MAKLNMNITAVLIDTGKRVRVTHINKIDEKTCWVGFDNDGSTAMSLREDFKDFEINGVNAEEWATKK